MDNPAIGSMIIRNVRRPEHLECTPMRASCTQVAGTLASDVLETDRARGPLAVLGSGAHHRLGLLAEVVGRNRVHWSAAQLNP